MRPTPDDRAPTRLEQSLDAWGRAAAHDAGDMPGSLAGAVTARRHARRAQQGGAALAIVVIALGAIAWLAPETGVTDPAPDDRPLVASAPSARLIDIRRANPAMDIDDLRLPETRFGAAGGPDALREALGLRPYEPGAQDGAETLESKSESSSPPSR